MIVDPPWATGAAAVKVEALGSPTDVTVRRVVRDDGAGDESETANTTERVQGRGEARAAAAR